MSALSLRSPRHKMKYDSSIEIARFSTTLNTSVPGSLSKLKKVASVWAINNNYSSIMTYVDRRIGSGAGYASCGFSLVGSSEVDYWYTDNYLRYDRFKFKAQKDKPENIVALEAGVSRIWGCGSQILLLNL